MKPLNYKLSEEFSGFLQKNVAGFLTTREIDTIIRKFKEESVLHSFTRTSEVNLIRILESQYDKVTLLNDCLKYPHHIEILTTISANSNYLTDIVVRNPEYLYQIFNQEYLKKDLSEESIITDIGKSVKKFHTFTAKMNILRNYKRKNILKVGLADLLGLRNFKLTSQDLSLLAKNICTSIFRLCYDYTLDKYGINNCTRKYVLVSLGKLGGRELNYSSDVDLICFYDKNEELKNIKKEYHEIITEAIQLFIKCCSEASENGYCYRIDFRLRPDGKFSPICRTMNDSIKYYEARGENWERQMLIKTDFVCGDKNLYDSFINLVKSFVYPASFISSPLEEIKKIKRDLERKAQSENNVKLSPGGIRDIEFLIQVLQLLNGGKIKEIQTGNTLEAIDLLHKNNLLKQGEAESLKSSYTFYRKIEHFLQLMNDLQTHTIPETGEISLKLSKFLGFKTIQEFKKGINSHRNKTKRIYNSVIKMSYRHSSLDFSIDKVDFIDMKRAVQNYKYLQYGTGPFLYKEFDKKTLELFKELQPMLLKYMRTSITQDLVLESFAKIIKNSSFPSIWYSELLNKNFFHDFLKLCETSNRFVDLLTDDKFNGELFLSRQSFQKNLTSLLNTLSIKQILFILSTQFGLKLISYKKISKLLSDSLLVRLKNVINNAGLEMDFFVGVMGSIGSGETNFESDIDLIFVSKDIESNPLIQNDFQNLLKDLAAELQPIRIDVRLRPEGKSSPLVWDITGYEKYLQSRARVWEFQSLLKLKFITGNYELFIRLKKVIVNSIDRFTPSTIKKEILNLLGQMKYETNLKSSALTNIKTANGGLNHIISFLDSIILSHREFYIKCIGLSTVQKFRFLVNNYKYKNDLLTLGKNFDFLKNVQFVVQNMFNYKNSIIPNEADKGESLAKHLKFFNYDKFKRKLDDVLTTNQRIIQKLWSIIT